MSLFKSHTSANESDAKKSMVAVLEVVISKYIITQKTLSEVLTGGDPEDCNVCKIDKLTKIMAKLETQVGQVTKSYELLFSEEAPVKQVTKEACKQHYPLLYDRAREKGKKSAQSSSCSAPSSTFSPGGKNEDSIRDAIVSAISKVTGTPIEDIHINGGLINKEALASINPGDFDSFEEYLAAVKEVSNDFDVDESKSGEEMLKEIAIKQAESSSTRTKGRPKGSTKPRTNA